MVLVKCVHLLEFMAAERKELGKAIDEDKYYMSERAHRDVGIRVATKDFLENYFEDWAKDFRREYCGGVCKDSKECELYQEYLRRQQQEYQEESR